MGTKSHISKINPDGTIKSSYVNFDGQPYRMGHTLLNHYSKAEKVDLLLEKGNLESVHPALEPDPNSPSEWQRVTRAWVPYSDNSYKDWTEAWFGKEPDAAGIRYAYYWYMFAEGEWYFMPVHRAVKLFSKWYDNQDQSVWEYLKPHMVKLSTIKAAVSGKHEDEEEDEY